MEHPVDFPAEFIVCFKGDYIIPRSQEQPFSELARDVGKNQISVQKKVGNSSGFASNLDQISGASLAV
jgi:hypothetical protein